MDGKIGLISFIHSDLASFLPRENRVFLEECPPVHESESILPFGEFL